MSDPVARLHACRAQLKMQQDFLRRVRQAAHDITGPYERAVCRALDEVWEAQIAVVAYLSETMLLDRVKFAVLMTNRGCYV